MIINKNVINVAKFSFIKSLKSKVFIVFNVIIFLCLLVAFNFNTVKDIFKTNDINFGTEYTIEIEDSKNIISSKLNEIKADYNIHDIVVVDKLKEYTLDNIEKEKIAIKIDYSEENFSIDIISKEKFTSKLYDKIVQIANEEKNRTIEEKYNISQMDASKYLNEISVNRIILDEESVVDENYSMLTFIMTMIIYFLVIFGTNAVASQIANEKTSKSAEYIFSSIPAKDYLNGKVIGANLKTLTSMLFMIFYVFVSLSFNSMLVKLFDVNNKGLENLEVYTENTAISYENVESSLSTFQFDNKVIVYIALNFIFILLTSVLLSYIQAGITAKVRSISDMDSSQSITLTIIVIAYFFAFSITGINNLFTKIVSNIPIFSMFLMPVNYLNDVASIYTVIISLIILIASIFITMHYVSKNFKKNILDIYSKNNKKVVVKKEETEEEKQRNIIRKKDLNSLGIVMSISLIALILLQAMLGMLLALVANKISPNIYNILLSLIFIISIAVPILIMNVFLEKNKTDNSQEKIKKVNVIDQIKTFFIGMAFIFSVQWIAEQIISKLGVSSDLINNSIVFDKSILGALLLIIQMAVLPAIFEELFFRKVMINSCKKYGKKFAIIISSIAFSLIHLNLSQSLVAFFIGILFAYLALKNNNIKVNIVLHFVNNFIATVTYIFSDNMLICNIINYVYIAMAIIGAILLIYNLFKNKEAIANIKKLLKTDEQVKIKDIAFNYYTVILLIFIVIMMVITY